MKTSYSSNITFRNETENRIFDDILFIQKNEGNLRAEPFIWKSISNCGFRNNHPFEFNHHIEIQISDSYGNIVAEKTIENGKLYAYKNEQNNTDLTECGSAINTSLTEVKNELATGIINVSVFRNKNIIYKYKSVCPNEIIQISNTSSLWVNKMPHIDTTLPVNEIALNRFSESVNLFGILKADIVMRGGGYGHLAKPFYFNLENIIYK